MRTGNIAAVLIVAIVATTVPAMAEGQDYKVVINQANTTTSITKANLSDCFMNQAKTFTWISGQPLIPVDQAASSNVRKAFSTDIHGRDVGAVKSYWQRQIFTGKAVPPQEKASDDEVLAFVRATPGAVGYVSADAELGPGVKELEIVE
jgi:ABC-type phosphate transport system substrate-binding protein